MSDNPQEHLLFLLGEMRADLKYLVNERRKTSDRMDALEAGQAAITAAHETRLTKLEHFRTKIGVVTIGLGTLVPTGIAVLAHILHMMQIGNEQFYHDPMLCGTNDLSR